MDLWLHGGANWVSPRDIPRLIQRSTFATSALALGSPAPASPEARPFRTGQDLKMLRVRNVLIRRPIRHANISSRKPSSKKGPGCVAPQ
jgi:hypothetical protein